MKRHIRRLTLLTFAILAALVTLPLHGADNDAGDLLRRLPGDTDTAWQLTNLDGHLARIRRLIPPEAAGRLKPDAWPAKTGVRRIVFGMRLPNMPQSIGLIELAEGVSVADFEATVTKTARAFGLGLESKKQGDLRLLAPPGMPMGVWLKPTQHKGRTVLVAAIVPDRIAAFENPAGGTLGEDDDFKAAWARLAAAELTERPLLTFARGEALAPIVREGFGPADRRSALARSFAKMLAIENLACHTLAADLVGDRVAADYLLTFGPGERGLFGLFLDRPARAGDPHITLLDNVPVDADGGWAVNVAGGDNLYRWVHAMMSLIDPAIAREMDEDLAALSKRSGVDIEKNVIGQIGDQVAAGMSAQVVPAIGVMATLKDPAVVKTAIEGLIDYAGLETDTHVEGKRWFVTLKGRDWPVTLGIDGDRLIIGSMPQATRAMVEARDGKRRLLDSADFRALYATLPREKAMLAFVDLAVQFRRMEELRNAGIEIPDEPMFAVASLTGRGDTAHASLRLSPRVEQLLTQALHRAAAQARRTTSINQLRQLALTAMLYAQDNEGRLPSNWSDLVPYIEDNLELVVSPNDPRDVKITKENIDATASYLFNETLRGAKLPDIERPHATPLFAEPIAFYNGKGTNFAFADGHVEWLPAEEAKKLIERMKKEEE